MNTVPVFEVRRSRDKPRCYFGLMAPNNEIVAISKATAPPAPTSGMG